MVGKWSQFQDSQMMSYDKLPDTNLLARIAGFTGLDDYCPFWIQVEPPQELVNAVLRAFKQPLQAAIKVHQITFLTPLDGGICVEM